jgi:hypothetical protein
MTREEIRGLIGAYATGSLSEAERKALFEAALDDQELFDELAREHALKELLDEPGVKARLTAALAPRQKRRWAKPWTWAAAGAFAVAVAVIAGLVFFRTLPQPEKTVEMARVTAPANPVPSPVVPAPIVPPLPVTPPVLPTPVILTPVVPNAATPILPAPAPVVAPPAVTQPVAPPQVVVDDAAPIVAVPAPQPAAPRSMSESVTVTAETPLLKTESAPAAQADTATSAGALSAAPRAAPAGGAAAGGGGRGGRGGGRGAGAGGALAQRAAVAGALPRFAFDYSVTPPGALRIVPAANGFLTVGSNNGSAMSVLFNNRPLQAGAATEVLLPTDCVSALVIFSASETPPGLLNITSPADAPSGTKSDPNPTPDSRLIAVVPVRR